MKLYLSGPMSGLPDYNRPEFNRVATLLRLMDHEVFNPADLKTTSYRLCLAQGLEWICKEAEGMVSLAGSLDSVGAKVEIKVAQACGLTRWVHTSDDRFWAVDGIQGELGREG